MLNENYFVLNSTYSEATDTVTLTFQSKSIPQSWIDNTYHLYIGSYKVLEIQTPKLSKTNIVKSSFFSISALLELHNYDITLKSVDGNDVLTDGSFTVTGDVLEALTLNDEDRYFERVQLNFSRIKPPRVLELAARASYVRFNGNFLVQASSLTVFAHRLLGREPRKVADSERDQIRWLIDCATPLVAHGEELIAAAGEKPDWRHVRWTVSLATVCGYLSLYLDEYETSAIFFGVARRYVRFVKYSKVSALNFICACFMDGMLSHLLGYPKISGESFIAATEGVVDCVQAQNMLENVWVLGDLIGVITVAHQCFISLARLNLIEITENPPMIDGSAQIQASLIKGPLRSILQAGLAKQLKDHIVSHGGSI